MPYGSLDRETLSQASRNAVERAVDWWQKSMQTTKHKTFLVLAGYDDDPQEMLLRQKLLEAIPENDALLSNVMTVSAQNEEALAVKIARRRELLPVETITVFVESRNAVSVKAIFKRKFGRTLQLRKFKADFEFNHMWVSTSTSFAWVSRNWLLRMWFEAKKRLGRGMRTKLRYWFRS